MKIVVGMSGGIAAYKAVGVVRSLVLAGHDVHVVPTAAALRFVGRPTLEAISRNPVETDLYEGVAEVRHVALGQSADLIVVAPATANTLATLTAGLADDLLGTTVLASTAPLVVAPAMHTGMWEHPATRANMAVLRARGVTVVGPEEGQLTGTDSGAGRMAEPADIVAAALAAAVRAHPGLDRAPVTTGMQQAPQHAHHKASHSSPQHAVEPAGHPAVDALAGLRVVVTAGGTREPLDPVRFVGNRSTGSQGVALAEAARDRGATVVLIAAHVEVPIPVGVDTIDVGTTEELRSAVLQAARTADVVIMAAAVADYRPASVAEAKMKKRDIGAALTLELVQNPDVLVDLVRQRDDAGPFAQTIVGFAAETEPDEERLLALGREKVAAKGCDYLVLNRVGWAVGFGGGDTAVTVLDSDGNTVGDARGGKPQVASRILGLVAPA